MHCLTLIWKCLGDGLLGVFFSFLSLAPWSRAVSLSLSAVPIQTNKFTPQHTSFPQLSSEQEMARKRPQDGPVVCATVTFGKWALIYPLSSKAVCSAPAKVLCVKWGVKRASRPRGKRWTSLECGGRSLLYPEKILEAGGKFSILVLDRRSKQLSGEFHLKLTRLCFGYSECFFADLTFSVSLKYCNWFPAKVEFQRKTWKTWEGTKQGIQQPVRTQPSQGAGGLGSVCIFLRKRHHAEKGQAVPHRNLLCTSLVQTRWILSQPLGTGPNQGSPGQHSQWELCLWGDV